MSSSDLSSYEAELEDWVEMLMRYMQRSNAAPLENEPVTMWQRFGREYLFVAADMERWLEKRHEENQDD